MEVNQDSKASVEFDLNRPLRLSCSGTQSNPNGDGTPVAYIYSRALDGFNSLRVATVTIANVCGLSAPQERALVERIAEEIVAPTFSEEEIEDIAFEIMDIDDYHTSVTDHHRARARQVAENITTRRRLNLSGVR